MVIYIFLRIIIKFQTFFAEDTVVKNTIVFIKNIEYQTFKGSRNDDLIYLLKANKLTQTFFSFLFGFLHAKHDGRSPDTNLVDNNALERPSSRKYLGQD